MNVPAIFIIIPTPPVVSQTDVVAEDRLDVRRVAELEGDLANDGRRETLIVGRIENKEPPRADTEGGEGDVC